MRKIFVLVICVVLSSCSSKEDNYLEIKNEINENTSVSVRVPTEFKTNEKGSPIMIAEILYEGTDEEIPVFVYYDELTYIRSDGFHYITTPDITVKEDGTIKENAILKPDEVYLLENHTWIGTDFKRGDYEVKGTVVVIYNDEKYYFKFDSIYKKRWFG